MLVPAALSAQTTWYVDDDAPNDLAPGDPTVSDPNEDGSLAHPFDAIQEGINAASDGDDQDDHTLHHIDREWVMYDVDITGLHHVNQPVTLSGPGIAGGSISLLKGDMLFTTADDENLSTAAGAPPPGWARPRSPPPWWRPP